MKSIEELNSVVPYGVNGFIRVNDEKIAILKKIDDDKFILKNEVSQIYYFDKSKKTIELISE